jgi:hypothetical protein
MGTTLNQFGQPPNLLARAKAIILTPDTEWPVIDAEPASVSSLYRNYIMILAAIPPLATFLHGILFGYNATVITYRPSFFGALEFAVVQYAFTLGGAYVLALIIDTLAPTFQGEKNLIQALKLVAYASTALWLAGIFSLLPGIGFLRLLGFYSLFLFYRGLPIMMKSPPDKAMTYTVVIMVAAFVVTVCVVPLTLALVGNSSGIGAYSELGGVTTGSITTPSGGELRLDKLQQAARAFADTAQRAQSGPAAPSVPSDTLKAMLPDSIAGGLGRSDVTTAGGQIAGFAGSSAEATYGSDGHQLTLTVADLGAVGALASFGGALGFSGNKETPTSYSRVSQQDGRTVAEEYDRQSRHGSYAVIVASRFMVTAEGSSISMDDLHNAVASVDVGKLETLGK